MGYENRQRLPSINANAIASGPLSLAREVCSMTESFGARLRQQRERQQIALAAIADQTKISLSLLD